ncbi:MULTISPECIES: thioredoxin [unclassified Variovorax]|uniref:thioredoxin n=1 Tax=unclassified Variovorax TaxID=663243 RepID=UPI003F456C59
MSTKLLDPWRDAAAIANALRGPTALLVVVLSAESWCQKCRDFKPRYEQVAADARAIGVWLWLDLEEHAEFLAGYVSDDLPWVLAYRGKTLWRSQAVKEMAALQRLFDLHPVDEDVLAAQASAGAREIPSTCHWLAVIGHLCELTSGIWEP